MNKRIFKLDELHLPLEDMILKDDELQLVKGGIAVTLSNGNCDCNCDCNCSCESNGRCNCNCSCLGPTNV